MNKNNHHAPAAMGPMILFSIDFWRGQQFFSHKFVTGSVDQVRPQVINSFLEEVLRGLKNSQNFKESKNIFKSDDIKKCSEECYISIDDRPLMKHCSK